MENYRIKDQAEIKNTLERQNTFGINCIMRCMYRFFSHSSFHVFPISFPFSPLPIFLSPLSLAFPRLSLSFFLLRSAPNFISVLPTLRWTLLFLFSFFFLPPLSFFSPVNPGCTLSRFCFQNPMADNDEIE